MATDAAQQLESYSSWWWELTHTFHCHGLPSGARNILPASDGLLQLNSHYITICLPALGNHTAR